MMYSAIASKYAMALYNVSKVNNKTEEYKDRLKVLAQIYDYMSIFLNNQAIKPEKRAQVVCQLMNELGFPADQPFSRFVYLLISNKRLKYIKQILAFFDFTVLEDKGLIPVDITAAMDLSTEEEKLLSEFVKKHSGREPVFSITVDENLIAGVVMEFAGKRFDASIKGRLENLARNVLRREG
ncbi:ATP synthase subunit delta [Fervidobacterium sp. SC_NGM5_O18]|uniref:ATP synthase subunit delta n=1 Tax=Fervidobacterium pennivorans TaxID=93466 RepID=A0A172T2Q6_FERPE|nr:MULTISPECIES: F0F1 ATP synthase subunit delta [Fervidobacterium]ANE41133.1 ATP synthase subunit delta [Fervidobacterium pennivorans]MDM7320375.1 F0F1 ATP synthase subunit delta [Fervidobacterium sp.]NPU88976.1 F0F1 ATP synthase subunit delta [Fervidobacterium sp.]PHJ13480.1 ATP synthase subunit delta [Fervidobacterium sp. SC_NGM5_O18]